MSAPYYQDDLVTLYHGDCRELLPSLWLGVTACITDPPYGIGYRVNARAWRNDGLDGLKPMAMAAKAPIAGDERPFDVSPLLGFPKLAIFGANHMAGLPTGGKWIVWDKRRDSLQDCHSDCELIWTNVPGADRIHRQKWRGVVREGEENCSRSKKLHSNQKPVALLDFVYDAIGVTPADTLIDPYAGSGSMAVVAKRRRTRIICIELEEHHCETAARRCSEEALSLNGAA